MSLYKINQGFIHIKVVDDMDLLVVTFLFDIHITDFFFLWFTSKQWALMSLINQEGMKLAFSFVYIIANI